MEVTEEGVDIAVVGMACRFPGARDVDQFWANLRRGVESISHFEVEELRNAGIPAELLRDPDYVRAKGYLEDIDRFDASFFGLQPRQAEILDPQHRLFLQCAWHSLEDAGHIPDRFEGRIGIFAGASPSSYLMRNLVANPEVVAAAGHYEALLGNDKDYLTSRTSYLLNLTGPSMAVQTACSTSLVAVHLARHSLLSYQCDLALAGGVSVSVPGKAGYLFQEGGILSPDGRCRPFDARAQGTVHGNGVGIVVLRRLEDAQADGDDIHAVIRGSAVNNDGSQKVGYTAPSVDGQALAIAEAQAVAEVDPDTVTYIEAHGTATPLGDPIEVAALKQVFRKTRRRGFCGLGSVKSNLGHLDTAAGVAGLIKTVLALCHREIPPSLHFDTPNPKLELEDGPFYVNDQLKSWDVGEGPRRAGVSSFGIGGTNCHVVLQEAPPASKSRPSREYQVLLVSAKSPKALEDATRRLGTELEDRGGTSLADVAYTLAVGRGEHSHRRAVVASTGSEAAAVLAGGHRGDVEHDDLQEAQKAARRGVAFLFPGQGSQYPGMGRELYEREKVFRRALDRCLEVLEEEFDEDPRPVLWEPRRREQLRGTGWAQSTLFSLEWSLAQMWRDWGVEPVAMVGHSLGEYVAACQAGVFDMEAGLRLVVSRGRLMEALPTGSMLSVPLPESRVREHLDRLDPRGQRLSLAVVNGPELCVVSGTHEGVSAMEQALDEAEVEDHRRLYVSHAFHSPMMEPILERFGLVLSRMSLRPPSLPWVSNLTGRWITAEEATSPDYWVRHLRDPVRFDDGLALLLEETETPLLEVGPGRALCTLARWRLEDEPRRVVASSMPTANADRSEDLHLRLSLGRLWTAGVPVDFRRYFQGETRRRVRLPGYPFHERSYWVEASADRPAPGDPSPESPKTSPETVSPMTVSPSAYAGEATVERLVQKQLQLLAEQIRCLAQEATE